ncbi:xanthine dehydrogenase accessory protein XdhC [Arthrobacter sp. Soil762]|uniref:xanthine dehydrogenase accessory protein XdhC n=1 Tax=Arthrobacter sp. Soil762 TaxID=1736401 RepID=UPI0006FCA330|nr:xanthine dehydrogenase accessory protein XdhC [Arthrobacter sp. Soil762]KRE72717.1 molybdenum cofactor sulfurylase [Arthrobacter sp. Soil762]
MYWLQALEKLRSEGAPGVMATVTDVRGHAPRAPGAKMVISAETSWGSIGGGNLEATVIDRAREMLLAGSGLPESVTFALNEHAATEYGRQCCGGTASVLLEPFRSRPTIAIFGVGHIGHELARILSRLPVRLILVDSRPSQLDPAFLADVNDGIADIDSLHSAVPDSALAELPKGSHVFIMTHDHAEDFLLCDAAVRRDDLGSVGLIGSRAKWARFRQRLKAEGHDDARIGSITCPIGLPDIGGKSPAVIAVSAAAGLLQLMATELSFSE